MGRSEVKEASSLPMTANWCDVHWRGIRMLSGTLCSVTNRRLYRIARSVLRDNTDAEDVVQKTYITAFSHLTTYRVEVGLGAWLSGIALNGPGPTAAQTHYWRICCAG